MEFISGMEEYFNLLKSVNVKYCANRIKGKSYMIISIDEENIWSSSIYIHDLKKTTLNKQGIEGNHLIIKKAMYEKPTANMAFNSE